MARIRLNLRRLSVTEKLAKERQIVTAMTNNTSFASPNPPLSDVTTGLDELEKAFGLVQSARSEVATRSGTQENAEARLDQLLTQLAGYVERVAGKDDTLITSAGHGDESRSFCADRSTAAGRSRRNRGRTRRRNRSVLEAGCESAELSDRVERRPGRTG
jgi:hypothetical protein